MGLFDRFKKKEIGAAPTAEIALLVRQLQSADARQRLEACRALGSLGPRAADAVPPLMELLTDDDGDVCNAAAAALSSIQNDRA